LTGGVRPELVQVQEFRSTGRPEAGQIAAVSPLPVADIAQSRRVIPHLPHIINLGLLIAGMAAGQGAIFAVQTWLLANGRFELLSWFGTHYSFAIFGIILTDGGTSTILARDMARLSSDQDSVDEFWRSFCEIIVFRLSVVMLLGLAAAVYIVTVATDGFSRSYLLCILPGLLLWVGNATGLLDGLRLSGISGLTGSLAYVGSAVALALVPNATPEMAGLILGAAFSGGYFLTVLAQWTILSRLGWAPRIRKVTAAGLIPAFKNGAAMSFQLVPGQIVLRVQLTLSAVYLGAETTAVFTYVRQLVTALNMVLAIVLRVDFPGLVQKVSRARKQSLWRILEAQKTTLYCSIALAAGTAVVSSSMPVFAPTRFGAAAMVLLMFTPTIFTSSFSLMMTQALLALGDYASVARITALGAAFGIAVSCLLITTADLYALVIGELVTHVFVFVAMYISIMSLNPVQSAS
jgi:O-antigen/teichoic acid export membrane protein